MRGKILTRTLKKQKGRKFSPPALPALLAWLEIFY
jgi:hypothetical protein